MRRARRLINIGQAARSSSSASGLVAFRTSEAAQAERDLNGDGDSRRRRPAGLRPARRRSLLNTGQAAIPCPPRGLRPARALSRARRHGHVPHPRSRPGRRPQRRRRPQPTWCCRRSTSRRQRAGTTRTRACGRAGLRAWGRHRSAGLVTTVGAVSAGVCTNSGRGLRDGGGLWAGGTCYLPPGECVVDLGTTCDTGLDDEQLWRRAVLCADGRRGRAAAISSRARAPPTPTARRRRAVRTPARASSRSPARSSRRQPASTCSSAPAAAWKTLATACSSSRDAAQVRSAKAAPATGRTAPARAIPTARAAPSAAGAGRRGRRRRGSATASPTRSTTARTPPTGSSRSATATASATPAALRSTEPDGDHGAPRGVVHSEGCTVMSTGYSMTGSVLCWALAVGFSVLRRRMRDPPVMRTVTWRNPVDHVASNHRSRGLGCGWAAICCCPAGTRRRPSVSGTAMPTPPSQSMS